MFDVESIAAPPQAQRLSPDTDVDVAFLRDPGDRMAPSADLFRSPAFFRLHAHTFSRAWYAAVMDGATGASIAGGWFAETAPGEARSGVRGPFGALHTPYEPLPIALATRMVAATEEELRARDIVRVRITLPPAAHQPASHAEWMNVYLRLGYLPAPPDLNYHVLVDDIPLLDRMNNGNRAIVRTAERKGMVARALQPDERADAFSVIVANRARRARPVTMSLESLLEMESTIPGVTHWFGVFKGGRMLAASVCMRLSPRCCYVFYLGEVDGMDRLSPVTLLVSHIHDWCRCHGASMLDLGIATESGVPNEGLMTYTRNLGFDVSPKYTLEKELSR